MDRQQLARDLRAALGSDKTVRALALRSLGQQLSLLRAGDFGALEQQLRSLELQPIDCQTFGRETAAWPLLAVATLHRSGWVRQAALHELADAPRAECLPFVLARLNDWVPPVRAAALRGIRPYLVAQYADRWIAMLGLVEALGRARRADHESLLAAVHELLRLRDVEPQLSEALRSPDPAVRRGCARLLMRRPSSGLLQRMSESPDPAVRLMALRATLADTQPDVVVLERSRGDAALPVRRRAVVETLRRGLVDAGSVADTLMFDRSLSIRDLAREWLRTHRAELDLAAVYRRAIMEATGLRQRVALIGLGETGGGDVVDVLLPYLDHASAPTRRYAIMALDALGTRVPAAPFVTKLWDPAAPVIRAAADALCERMDPTLVPAVWRAIKAGPPTVAWHAARCFARLETWQALVQLCELIPRAPDVCSQQLESWLRRHRSGFLHRPTAEAITRAGAALRFARATVPDGLVRELEFVLRTIV